MGSNLLCVASSPAPQPLHYTRYIISLTFTESNVARNSMTKTLKHFHFLENECTVVLLNCNDFHLKGWFSHIYQAL